MSVSAFPSDFLDDPRLAPYATRALPVWLWADNATRVLWANAAGAAVFGAPHPAALALRLFDAGQPAAAAIAEAATRLITNGTPMVVALRGHGAGAGQTLRTECRRVELADGRNALLVLALDAAGPVLSLQERTARLLDGTAGPVAAFGPDGRLLFANRAAQMTLGGAGSIGSCNIEGPAAEARARGRAERETDGQRMILRRIGSGADEVLVAQFVPRGPAAAAETAPAETATGTAGLAAPAAAVPDHAPPAAEPAAATPPQPAAPQAESMPAATAASAAAAAETAAPHTEPPAPQAAPPLAPAAATTSASITQLPERRHPLRFVWQMDADEHFTLGPGEFVDLIGPRGRGLLGQSWSDIARVLALDPRGEIARAIASRDTWSGIEVGWPVNGDRLKVEMAGLPVFDRERRFGGYRGFGVCRDLGRIAALLRSHSGAPAAFDLAAPIPEPAEEPPSVQAVSPNVLPFRPPADAKPPSLNAVERHAFRELARKLTERLRETEDLDASALEDTETAAGGLLTETLAAANAAAAPAAIAAHSETRETRPVLDRLPLGLLIYQVERPLYANPAFLDWIGCADLAAFEAAGGLDSLLIEPEPLGDAQRKTLAVSTARQATPMEARLFTVPWDDGTAHVLVLVSARIAGARAASGLAAELAQAENRELKSIIEAVADGVLVLAAGGKIISGNARAEALFGAPQGGLIGRDAADLLVPEQRRIMHEALAALAHNDNPEGREVIGRSDLNRELPLFMTVGRVAGGDGPQQQKFCVVFRDLAPWKRIEVELTQARRTAERASQAKSEFLAKISHEIRTPLNAIIGFSEVMMDERLGALGNDRYREYLRDIHASGGHVVSLLNDLLDLSKIEAGKLDLSLGEVNLNEVTQQCVALMQPQANRERIIIRTSLTQALPPALADERSVKQIVLNLLSNAIKFTGAGGQVIVSTAHGDDGEVVLRVRDTGVGMSPKDLAVALEPFRQLATSPRGGSGGTGLGLPLTKALAEANRARFDISSAPKAGTLVEISFRTAAV